VNVGVFQQGDKGDAVQRIQNALSNAGFTVPMNANFDAATKVAVQKFQDSRGLAADGVVGYKTLRALGIAL
jgi:peptidoglycan hydrolase-like protein with peptidoglycan-binding domain